MGLDLLSRMPANWFIRCVVWVVFKRRCMCYLGDRDIPFSSTSFIMFAFFSVEY